MTFFTKHEVEKMSIARAKKSLKDLTKLYNLDKPLREDGYFQKVWPTMDDICNSILYLEDHIQAVETSERNRETALRK